MATAKEIGVDKSAPVALERHGQSTVKAKYLPPKLTAFGNVRDLTQSTGSKNGDGGQSMMLSDRAVKENIVEIGRHPLGIGLYLFDYKPAFRAIGGEGRQLGVMADEVEAVLPGAVSMHRSGFKQVDYGMLGIRQARH